MAIVFTDLNSVEVDGVAAGDIVSVLSNYPTRKNETLNAFKAFRTTENDSQQAKVTKAESDLATANATITTLQAQIDKLVVYRPFNPRYTTAPFFISRFTAQEAKVFFSSNDPTLVGGQTLFDAYELNNWYIDLDDPQVQGLTEYMVALGIFTEDRRKQVLRDATAQEAYYPPEVVV